MTKKKARTVMGIDASSHSLAFAIFTDGKPVRCGEIRFVGSTPFERLLDAKKKVRALVAAGILRADYVGIEAAVMVRNMQVVITLAYFFGVIIGELMEFNPEVHQIAPISWQTGIGNPNLTPKEKELIKREFPGQKKSWYQNRGRELRKQRTLDIAREFFKIEDGSDNVGDAVGIALYVDKTLTRA